MLAKMENNGVHDSASRRLSDDLIHHILYIYILN